MDFVANLKKLSESTYCWGRHGASQNTKRRATNIGLPFHGGGCQEVVFVTSQLSFVGFNASFELASIAAQEWTILLQSNWMIFTQVEVNIENLSKTQYTGWLNSRISMGNFIIPVKPNNIHRVFDEFMVKRNQPSKRLNCWKKRSEVTSTLPETNSERPLKIGWDPKVNEPYNWLGFNPLNPP